MNRVEVLLRTPAVTLSVFDHPPGEAHDDPAGEAAGLDAIAFVEAGTFTVAPLGRGRDAWSFAPGMLFVTSRGMEFACSHDEECPADRCLSLSYAPDAVEDLRSAGVAAIPGGGAALQMAPRHRFLRHRVLSCGTHGADAASAMRLELVAAALVESLGAPAPPRGRPEAPVSDVMRRVARAAERMESDHASPLTLRDVASTAGMSAYHFARVFRDLTGLPPHRYLMAVRLRRALLLLEQGASVTETCYDVGFASLSHFTTTFRRRFGVAPSALPGSATRSPALRAALASPVWERAARRGGVPA